MEQTNCKIIVLPQRILDINDPEIWCIESIIRIYFEDGTYIEEKCVLDSKTEISLSAEKYFRIKSIAIIWTLYEVYRINENIIYDMAIHTLIEVQNISPIEHILQINPMISDKVLYDNILPVDYTGLLINGYLSLYDTDDVCWIDAIDLNSNGEITDLSYLDKIASMCCIDDKSSIRDIFHDIPAEVYRSILYKIGRAHV